MRGVVSCIRHGSTTEYFVASIDGNGVSTDARQSDITLHTGETVETEEEGRISTALIEQDKGYVSSVLDAASKASAGVCGIEPYASGIRDVDSITERIWPRLASAASLLVRKLLLGLPVIVRFHNDSDGLGGAYALYKSIGELKDRGVGICPNIIWLMNKGVSYTREDAGNDTFLLNGYETIEKPLLVMIDFGTSKDSNSGMESIGTRADVVWLDHHPIPEGFSGTSLEHYINPWDNGGDSNYTAGFLAAALAKTFSKTDTKETENASFIGDYSRYADEKAKGYELSMIMDLLTSDPRIVYGYTGNDITPKELDVVLGDGKRRNELYNYAKMRLEEALDRALPYLKQYKAEGYAIYLLDFEDIRDHDSKYPLPGRFATRLLDKVMESGNGECAVIVHAGSYISIRLSKKVCSTMSILPIISELKSSKPDEIEAGGGHDCAASIKVYNKESKKEVIKALVERLKSVR
ncbi:MAG: hypothetical protein KGH69_01665 [Candidatus Micrarchaeota archaeon]|nr:hypothetical protein [Candidatus Micrarchaeota archaeon]